MRRPICIVLENEDYLEELFDEEDKCGGIIYKKDDEIVEEYLSAFEIQWFCDHIKEVKKQYKKFILYRYHSEFNLWEYEDYPSRKSGVLKYFCNKYPYHTWDVMW